MFKIIRPIILVAFILVSFYITDFSIKYSKKSSNLMKEILSNQDKYLIASVNGIVSGNTIIPGINGKKVNVDKSYNNMLKLNSFDEKYLLYSEVVPTVSVEKNKDKYIISGNKLYNRVALVLEDISLFTFFKNTDINLTILVDEYIRLDNVELINNTKEDMNFSNLDRKLDSGKDICVINGNEDICRKNNKYLIKPNVIYYNKNSILSNEIDNGSIILVKKSINEEDAVILLSYLNSKNLEIEYLSNLISEKR